MTLNKIIAYYSNLLAKEELSIATRRNRLKLIQIKLQCRDERRFAKALECAKKLNRTLFRKNDKWIFSDVNTMTARCIKESHL